MCFYYVIPKPTHTVYFIRCILYTIQNAVYVANLPVQQMHPQQQAGEFGGADLVMPSSGWPPMPQEVRRLHLRVCMCVCAYILQHVQIPMCVCVYNIILGPVCFCKHVQIPMESRCGVCYYRN